MRNPWLARSIFLIVLIACIPLYWPGLHGTFVFDDIPNLGTLQLWLNGHAGWRTVVFENLAGPLGRPLSMATFLADGAIWGMDPFGFKLTNLLLHLVIGVTIYLLVLSIARRDRHLNANPELIAAAVSAIWLLHPLHAGTVLYIIQRMAMLSALFIVLAMLAYIHGRECIERGAVRRGMIWLFTIVPLLTVLGAFSKENGLLALLLCGVVEWVYFRPPAGDRRPPAVRWFQAGLVGGPIMLGLLALLLKPDLFLSGYENRTFTLVQRLLTESRVLFDYLGKLLLPVGNKFSLMRDDYAISTGLTSPPTTALALLGWAVIVTAVVRLRAKLPSFSAGVGIFLAGHAIESGVFPLMVYYEHRNYMPSIGIFITLAGLAIVISHHAASRMDHPRPVGVSAFALLLATLAFATHGRALVWQTKELLIRQSVEAYPDSRFVRAELAAMEMNRPIPNPEAAREQFRYLVKSERLLSQMNGRLGLIKIDCLVDGNVQPIALQQAFATIPDTMEADLVMSLRGLADLSKRRQCTGLDPETVAQRLAEWLEKMPFSEAFALKARLRIEAAKLFADAGLPSAAIGQAEIAMPSGLSTAELTLLLASQYIEAGAYTDALKILEIAKSEIDEDDQFRISRLEEYTQSAEAAMRYSRTRP